MEELLGAGGATMRTAIVAPPDLPYGLARLYEELAHRYNELPFVSRTAVDLDEHVTDEALEGLFLVLGEEEKRIREDPVARTTALLRRVFG